MGKTYRGWDKRDENEFYRSKGLKSKNKSAKKGTKNGRKGKQRSTRYD